MPTANDHLSQMIWGAMSVNGTLALYFLPEGVTINGLQYVKLLQDKLQLHIAVHQCSLFIIYPQWHSMSLIQGSAEFSGSKKKKKISMQECGLKTVCGQL